MVETMIPATASRAIRYFMKLILPMRFLAEAFWNGVTVIERIKTDKKDKALGEPEMLRQRPLIERLRAGVS